MDRFMNMTSTVTNWWSSGNEKQPGKDEASAKEEGGEAAAAPAATEESTKEKDSTKNQDAEDEEESPPTSEADSVRSNQSEAGETPGADDEAETTGSGENSDGKAFGAGIQVGINEVSTKAIESAKNFGSFLFSVANKAGKTVSDTAKQLKHTVEENSILGEFNKEQETFLKEKNQQRTDAAVPPWVGYSEEEVLKQQIMSLSMDRRNFLRCPPSGVQFQFDFDAMHPVALATLAEDPNLEKIRFELVPKLINEENFWKNYFYRVSLIKQSTQLSSLAQETSSTGGDSNLSSRQSSVEEGMKGGSRGIRSEDKGDDGQLTDSPMHEFVSDAYQGNVVDKDELRKGMKQLGMKDSNEEEWEKEVQQELQEYEVVMGADNQNLDDGEWEKEVQQMLESQMSSTSKEKA